MDDDARRRHGRAYYVYGIVPDEGPLELLVPGVGGGDVFTVTEGPVAAIASEVSLSEFGEEPLRKNLNDLDWLGAVARTHESVLEDALARRPVLPARVATVYLTVSDVREMLERDRGSFLASLRRVRGAREWGLKAFADPDRLAEVIRASSARAAELERSAEGKTAGAGYFARRALSEFLRRSVEDAKASCAAEVHDRVLPFAAEHRLNPLTQSALSPRPGELILNGVYLVREGTQDAFCAEVRALESELRPQGILIQLTGPWPPYNFADPPADD